jgi:ribosomal protein S18 acetylase RimI-like enzyme
MPLLPLAKLTTSELAQLRRLLALHPLFTLYFEAGIDALARGEHNRSVLVGKTGRGLALSIDFSGLTVRTTVGELAEDELMAVIAVAGPAEFHLEFGHLEFALRLLAPRILAEKRLRYYQLKAPTGFAMDPRCRFLTRADERIVASFFRDFYPTTIFSPWMLDQPFMGLLESGRLRSCAGVVVQNHLLGLANLGNFLTHPDWRGMGFAKTVARSLIHKLEEAGLHGFLLATTDDNIPARRVYEALGFCAFEERPQLNIK